MQVENLNEWNGRSESGGRFTWMPDSWYCGTPDQTCRHCGLPVIFAPSCLGIESCACDRAPHVDAPARDAVFTLAVKFARPVHFQVPVARASRGLSRR